MNDNLGCLSKIENVFWNLVFLADVGGVIGLAIVAIDRWPWLIKRLDTLFTLAGALLMLLLFAGLLWTHILFPYHRGVWIHGVHYEDIWRDD